MSCERTLNFDQWNTFSEIYKPIDFDCGLFTNLLVIIVACGFSPNSFKLKQEILHLLATYFS